MPSGLKSNGVDLDSILKARTTSPRPDVNIQTDGVDEANRFEKSSGGDTPPVATNFKSATTDFQVLFQDINYGGLLYAFASVNPSAGAISNGPLTTNSTTITAGGGNPGYSFSWAYVSGDASLTCLAPTSATTAWSGSGAAPQTKSAVWRCTVTDAFPHTVTVDVTVTINFYGALSITLNKGSVTGTRIGNGVATSDAVAGSPSGGSGGYSYAWQYLSGSTQPQPDSIAGSSTTFSYNGVAVQTFVGTWRLMVQDSLGNQAFSGNVTVTLNFTSATVNVSVDKTIISGTHPFGGGPQETDVVTGTASGGVAPYSYLWERISGDTGMSATTPTAAATTIGYGLHGEYSQPGDVFTSRWRLRVTDSVSTIGYSNYVDATITYSF